MTDLPRPAVSAAVASLPVAELSLRRNIVYAMVGRGYYAVTQFLIIAITARLGSVSDVGALTLATALVTPLFFFTSMGAKTVMTVDDFDRFTRADYVGLRFAGGLLALAASMLTVALAYPDGGWLVTASVAGVALVRFFGAQAALNQAIFQRAERLDYVAASIFTRATAGLAAFALVFWWSRDLPMALFCEAGLWFASYWLIDTRLLARLGMEIPLAILRQTTPRRIWALTLWVLPMGLALWLMRAVGSIPPVMLEHYAGLGAVGIFGALAYAHTLMSMVSNAMAGAAAARLRCYARERQMGAFRTLTRKMMLLSGGLGLGALVLAWIIGAPVLGLVFGPDYADRELFTVIVGASGLALVAATLNTAITALHAFGWRVAVAGASFLAGLAVALALVPSHGALGGAVAFLASSAVSLLMSWGACRLLIARARKV